MRTNRTTTLVVDFDRTVYDSDALYQDLYSLCETMGIPRDLLDYSLGFVPPDNLLFNFFLMVERGRVVEGSRLVRVIAELQKFVRAEGRRHVFSDVDPFMNSAIKAGCTISILTYGDVAFQLAKFVGSGLSASCHNFTATRDVKWQRSEMFSSSSVIFLDDNPRDIDGVKGRFPTVTAVEVKRPGTKYYNVHSSKADAVVDRLGWPLTQ